MTRILTNCLASGAPAQPVLFLFFVVGAAGVVTAAAATGIDGAATAAGAGGDATSGWLSHESVGLYNQQISIWLWRIFIDELIINNYDTANYRTSSYCIRKMNRLMIQLSWKTKESVDYHSPNHHSSNPSEFFLLGYRKWDDVWVLWFSEKL